MKLFKKFLSNKGFTLVEVMISAGIIAVVGTGVMVAMNIQNDSKIAKKRSENVDKAHKTIRERLSDRNVCRSTTQGLGGSPTKTITNLGGIPFNTNLDEGAGAFTGNFYGISITNAVLTMGAPAANGFAMGTLNITYSRNAGNQKAGAALQTKIKGSPAVVKSLRIQAKMVGGNIVECSTNFLEEVNKELSCQNAGGTWVAPANNTVEGTCELNGTDITTGQSQTSCDTVAEGTDPTLTDTTCVADPAMCAGLGGCWDWSSPEPAPGGTNIPGCSFTENGLWSYLGGSPAAQWSACSSCDRSINQVCLEGTCGGACTNPPGSQSTTVSARYADVGNQAVPNGSSPAGVTNESGSMTPPTCAMYATWNPNAPIWENIYGHNCTKRQHYTCSGGTCGAENICTTADPGPVELIACDTAAPGCANQSGPAPTYSGTCNSGCNESVTFACNLGPCQTACSGLPAGCVDNGNGTATCTTSACTLPGTPTSSVACTSCNQQTTSWSCGPSAGGCPSSGCGVLPPPTTAFSAACSGLCPSCVPSTSCAAIAAAVCIGTDAGSDSCGTACGDGTMICGGGSCDYATTTDCYEYECCAAGGCTGTPGCYTCTVPGSPGDGPACL